MSVTASKMMLQDPSSCHVLKGAWGKTSSGAGKYFPNLHAGKRSFPQMVKSAAHIVLLLIFVVQTAHSAHSSEHPDPDMDEKTNPIETLKADQQQMIFQMNHHNQFQDTPHAADDDKLRDIQERICELAALEEDHQEELRGLASDLQARRAALGEAAARNEVKYLSKNVQELRRHVDGNIEKFGKQRNREALRRSSHQLEDMEEFDSIWTQMQGKEAPKFFEQMQYVVSLVAVIFEQIDSDHAYKVCHRYSDDMRLLTNMIKEQANFLGRFAEKYGNDYSNFSDLLDKDIAAIKRRSRNRFFGPGPQ